MSRARVEKPRSKKSAAIEVVTFGEILWDIYAEEATKRPTRDAKSKRTSQSFEGKLGGAPCNVAVHLARIGIRSAMVGGVGRDFLGDALLAAVKEEGVCTDWLFPKDQRTGVAFIKRSRSGEPTYLFYRSDSADLAFDAEDAKRVDLAELSAEPKWWLFTTATLARPSMEHATWVLAEEARAHGTNIVVDLNIRPNMFASKKLLLAKTEELLSRADWVKGSEVDFERLGFRTHREIQRWMERVAPSAILTITASARPAITHANDERIVEPSLKTKVVDATGGGDAFLAGMLSVLCVSTRTQQDPLNISGETWRRAMKWGQIMGAKTMTRVGALAGTEDRDSLAEGFADVLMAPIERNEG
ncbi:MAG: carbohydrate kinase [Polyangiaceae bacterium]|nr:carbohydrate kinase [Polyangiaceae bacterium]